MLLCIIFSCYHADLSKHMDVGTQCIVSLPTEVVAALISLSPSPDQQSKVSIAKQHR